ncbi:MAG TPA: hypothetical protein VIL34_07195 [Actinopolymorphaceae bacterium]|jgi:hypothetical protein
MDFDAFWTPLTTLGLLLVLVCSLGVISPRLGWRIEMFGKRWWFANPDQLEPSGCVLVVIRVSCLVGLVIGVVLLVNGARAAVVDTAMGTPGWEAQYLDRHIRQLARSTGGDPRDPRLAAEAADKTREAFARYICRPGPPKSYTQEEGSSLCVDLETSALRHDEHIEVDSDYSATGYISIRRDPRVERGQSVCLVVAEDPRVRGEIDAGPCPGMEE